MRSNKSAFNSWQSEQLLPFGNTFKFTKTGYFPERALNFTKKPSTVPQTQGLKLPPKPLFKFICPSRILHRIICRSSKAPLNIKAQLLHANSFRLSFAQSQKNKTLYPIKRKNQYHQAFRVMKRSYSRVRESFCAVQKKMLMQ